MSYDSKCYILAEHFVGSAEELEPFRRALAQEIQTRIEDWIDDLEDDVKEKIAP